MSESLLTAEQVAQMLNLKRVTVYAAAASGRIPCVRLWKGRRRTLLRFRRDDIEQFLIERTRPLGDGGSES